MFFWLTIVKLQTKLEFDNIVDSSQKYLSSGLSRA
jgi:hypothetical protein